MVYLRQMQVGQRKQEASMTLTARVPVDTYDRFKALVEREQTTANAELRRLVELRLQNEKAAA